MPLYERVMGERFARLPSAVQRFHRLSGRVVLHGRVQTDAPASWMAALLARMLGTPRHASEGALRFELDASPDVERWTRHFPRRTMASRLQGCDGCLEEHLGAARLTFELTAGDGVLQMRLVRMRFLGLPCPRWLMPRITAEETGDAAHLNFHVNAALPWIGTVAGYRGHLVLAAESSR